MRIICMPQLSVSAFSAIQGNPQPVVLSTVLPAPLPHANPPTKYLCAYKGEGFPAPATRYTLLFCLVSAFCNHLAVFPNCAVPQVLLLPRTASTTLLLPTCPPRQGATPGYPLPCIIPFIPQITRANERWAYSWKLLQMGKVRSNKGEGRITFASSNNYQICCLPKIKSFSAITNTPGFVHSVES